MKIAVLYTGGTIGSVGDPLGPLSGSRFQAAFEEISRMAAQAASSKQQAAKQRNSETAKQRNSETAKQRNSETAKQQAGSRLTFRHTHCRWVALGLVQTSRAFIGKRPQWGGHESFEI